MNNEEIVSKINEIEKIINEKWSEVSPSATQKVKQTWDDAIGDEYIKNVESVGKTVDKMLEELELLKECWQKYNISK